MVKLFCAVVGVGSVFSVNIELSETVDDLKKKIKGEKPGLIHFDADLLKLYLAREGDTWLNSRHAIYRALKKGEIPDGIKSLMQEELLLDETWSLNNDAYFGDNLERVDGDIHVLVELPTQVAAPSDVIPSLPPTTIHRHPERLKRWAAINAMIRQKNEDANQDANQKTTTEGAKNKKRKNHDIDKSVGYSTLCWEDIKRIYDFDDSYELPSSDIPDADIELLLTRIRDLRELYGQISSGKDAKRLFFIAPILETVSRLLGDVRILVEEDVVGRNVLLKGRFEFVLKRGTKRISIVEAKREDMQQGVVQNVTGLEALADVEDLTVAYGIVTNFLEWKFLISGDEKVREHETVLPQTNTIPTFEGLKEIVGKIYRMLSNE